MEGKDVQHALAVGTFLKSPKYDYRIEEVLGKGGFGITYKVSTTVMFGKVPIFTYFAVKEHFLKDACERVADTGEVTFSRPLKSRVEESLQDFLSEARRLNGISGENEHVVPVSEVFEANNTVYYVMEYLNGGSLRDLVARQGALKEDEAVSIIKTVADAVAFLHKHTINHLDIKPDNVMFRVDPHRGESTPVLIDFGLAKHFDKSGKPTSTIRVQGCSDGYAPVEQYSGLQSFAPEADVYALGATLYYMLTGKSPVISTELQPDTVEKALSGRASAAVVAAVKQAMAYNKYDRTSSVADFLKSLEGVAEVSPDGSFATRVIEKTPADKDGTPGKKDKAAGGTPTVQLGKKGRAAQGSSTLLVGNKNIGMSVSGSKKWIMWTGIGLVGAILLALGCWSGYNLMSAHLADKEMLAESEDAFADYERAGERCRYIIDNVSSGSVDSLILAKNYLTEVFEYEDKYARINPDFNKGSDLESDLKNLLEKAAQDWVTAAETQISMVGDYAEALKYYRIAYELNSSPEIGSRILELESYDSGAVAADSAAVEW